MLRIALLAALSLGTASVASAQQVPAAAAPATWIRYAEQATATVSAWLQADDPHAVRLRAALGQPGGEAAPAPLIVSLWVDPDGKVARIAAPSLADAAATRDLEALIVGRSPAGRPPRGMKLPLRILVEAKPDAGAVQAAAR